VQGISALHAFVVMPDYVDVLTPDHDASLKKAFRFIRVFYGRRKVSEKVILQAAIVDGQQESN